MSVENSGMNKSSFKEQSMKHMLRDSLERMPAVVDMISMFMFRVVLELIFAVKNLLLLRALKASPEDPD
jgi:hypothetical protein